MARGIVSPPTSATVICRTLQSRDWRNTSVKEISLNAQKPTQKDQSIGLTTLITRLTALGVVRCKIFAFSRVFENTNEVHQKIISTLHIRIGIRILHLVAIVSFTAIRTLGVAAIVPATKRCWIVALCLPLTNTRTSYFFNW